MPRNQQIVPPYPYPYEYVVVNDNSAQDLTEDISPAVEYPYICVFVGPKGPANKLVKMTSLPKYQKTFGKTDGKKYGQPNLMPTAILSQTNAVAWCMRVVAKDVAYANSVLSLWYKEDIANKAFRIKFTAKSIGPDFNTQDTDIKIEDVLKDPEFITEMAQLTDGVMVDGVFCDDDGYTQVPLGVFVSSGPGTYGQNLRWRIIPDETDEKEFGMKFFTFEILDVENGATVADTKSGTIVSAIANDDSIFINDIIEDTKIENLAATINIFEDNVVALYEKYKEFCLKMIEADPTITDKVPTLQEFDPFFGIGIKEDRRKSAPVHPFIKFTSKLTDDVDTTADDYIAGNFTSMDIISVDAVAGNSFQNGSDGSFEDPDPDVRRNAINTAYIDAFLGNTDRTILAARRIPSMSLFDANYDMPVKMALVQLALWRRSGILYLDCNLIKELGNGDTGIIKGISQEFSEIDELVEEFSTISDETCPISINIGCYKVKDPSTSKRVDVTITYYLAATDVKFLSQPNLSARTNSRATLSGHIRDSLRPTIQECDTDLMTALYDARINYFEAIGENVFERATQSCYVHGNSDLLEETNMVELLRWISTLQAEARNNRYMHTTKKGRNDFKEYIEEKYNYKVGTAFETMSVNYGANTYEQKRSITHLYTAVTFPTYNKQTIIEVDVNKRTIVPDDEESEE